MKKIYNLFSVLAIIIIFAILPIAARAAALSFSVNPQQVYAGDVFVVSLDLESASEKINVAEVSLSFDGNMLEVKNVSTGGSIFSQWAKSPVFDNQIGKISFIGGTPNSFSGNLGKMLKIAFYAKQKGQTVLGFSTASAVYLADGKGTKIFPHLNNGIITILDQVQNKPSTNQWDEILVGDKTPPENLNITLGKDPSMFGGRYFLSFFAEDKGSGIDYYEIKEGDGNVIHGESPHILIDQSLKTLVVISAVDKAGNRTTQQVSPKQFKTPRTYWYVIITIGVMFLFGIAVWGYLKRKNIKNKI